MVSKVGEGTYGIVLKCRARDSGELVAIKKFKSPITGGTGDSEQVGSAAVAGGWGEGTGWQAGRCACLPVPLYGARHATHLPTAGGRCYCCTTHLPSPPPSPPSPPPHVRARPPRPPRCARPRCARCASCARCATTTWCRCWTSFARRRASTWSLSSASALVRACLGVHAREACTPLPQQVDAAVGARAARRRAAPTCPVPSHPTPRSLTQCWRIWSATCAACQSWRCAASPGSCCRRCSTCTPVASSTATSRCAQHAHARAWAAPRRAPHPCSPRAPPPPCPP